MTYTAPSAAAPSPPGIARSLLSRLEALLNAAGDRDRVRRDAGLAFLVRVASAALMYLSQILLARWMGAFDYGIYVFVWTFVLVLGGLSHLGLSMVAMRLLPQYRETGEAALARGLLFASRATALGVGTLVALAGVGALYLFGDRLAAGYLWPAYLALICLPVYALSDVQDGIGRGRGWMIAGLVPPYILRPLLVLIGMVAAHGVGLPMVAATAVGAAIVATWAAVVIQTLMLARRLRRDGPAGPRQYDLSRWLRVGAPLLAIYACELVFQNADVLIVSAYLTPVEVAMYFAASKTIGLVRARKHRIVQGLHQLYARLCEPNHSRGFVVGKARFPGRGAAFLALRRPTAGRALSGIARSLTWMLER